MFSELKTVKEPIRQQNPFAPWNRL